MNDINEMILIDDLAADAGGFVVPPSKDDLEYLDLLFDICGQFGIRYYSATPTEKNFVEEVTRVTWAVQQERKLGKKLDYRPAFSA